jgi:translation elongation factor EF-Tu-like GTPase
MVLMVITHLCIQGSATGALAGEEKWVKAVEDLMEAVDSYIPLASAPDRSAIPDER